MSLLLRTPIALSQVHWAVVLAATLCGPTDALAHFGGLPSVALPTAPECAGVVVDESIVLPWFDRDTEEPEGIEPVLIDLHYTAEMPVTFYPWERPDMSGLQDLALDIPLADTENQVTWDTSEVPTGVYWILAIAVDRKFEVVAIAPGPVTVAHPGDPVPPSVAIVQSDAAPDIADLTKVIEYCAHDPDGSATVRIEVTDQLDGTGLRLLAEGLPASAEGTLQWDTSRELEGDWLIRATVTDERGLSASAWGRYFVRVFHERATPDDAGEGEGEGTDDADEEPPNEGGDEGVDEEASGSEAAAGEGQGEGTEDSVETAEGSGQGRTDSCCSVSGRGVAVPLWPRR